MTIPFSKEQLMRANARLMKTNQRYKRALGRLRKHAMTSSVDHEDDGSPIEDHTMRFIYEVTTEALEE